MHLGKGKESDNLLPSGIFQNVPFLIVHFASHPFRTFISYYSLLITHYSLLITYYSLLINYYLLLTLPKCTVATQKLRCRLGYISLALDLLEHSLPIVFTVSQFFF